MAVSRINEAGLNVNQYGNRNLVINGAMEVAQRGTDAKTGNATDLWGTDRFRATENNSGSMSSQQVADGPVGFYYSNKLTITGTDSSLASTEYGRQLTTIEGQNMAHLNWGTANAQTVTLSFYVKCSVTGTFYISLFNSAADRSFVAGYTIDAANTWERKSIKIAGPTDGTWLATNGVGVYVTWSIGAGSAYQTSTLNSWASAFDMSGSDQVNLFATNAATWQLTGVQMELGDTATPFEHRSYGAELALCQRYFYSATNGSTGYLAPFFQYSTSGNLNAIIEFPVTMRAEPTLSHNAATSGYFIGYGSGLAQNWTTLVLNEQTLKNATIYNTQYNNYGAGSCGGFYVGSTSAYLHFDAEL